MGYAARTTAERQVFGGDREAVRRQSVALALRRLLDLVGPMSAEAGDSAPPASRRVFFALWPDDAVRAQIVRATREAVGVRAAAGPRVRTGCM